MTEAATPSTKFPPENESELLAEIVTHLQWTGLEDPACQIYSPSSIQHPLLDFVLMLLIVHNLTKMITAVSTGFLVGKKLQETDGWILLTGLVTFINHQNPQVLKNLWERLQQAKNSFTLNNDTQELTNISLFMRFLQQNSLQEIIQPNQTS